MCLRAATCMVIRTVARLDRVILRGLGSTQQRREATLTPWLFHLAEPSALWQRFFGHAVPVLRATRWKS